MEVVNVVSPTEKVNRVVEPGPVDELPDSITTDDLMDLEEAIELLAVGDQAESG